MKTIIEPFRIKTVEPIKMTTREERLEILKRRSTGGNVLPQGGIPPFPARSSSASR